MLARRSTVYASIAEVREAFDNFEKAAELANQIDLLIGTSFSYEVAKLRKEEIGDAEEILSSAYAKEQRADHAYFRATVGV
jgi:hypothetical protein